MRRCLELIAPLLVCAFMFFPDERTRWLAVGLITSCAAAAFLAPPVVFCVGPALRLPGQPEGWPHKTLILGIALVRWLPLRDVMIWRELIVLTGVLIAYVAMRDESPLAVAAAIAIAVVTPVIPGRGLLFPFIVAALTLLPVPFRLAAAASMLAGLSLGRASFASMFVVGACALALPLVRRIPVIPQTAVVALFALWPWSGLLARSFPAFLHAAHVSERNQTVGAALEPSRSVSVPVPEGIRTVTITASGAQASRLWPGTLLGRIDVIERNGEVTSRDIRIGDVADFGFMRREHYLSSHNRPALTPCDDFRGFGATSWLYGAGRMAMTAAHDIATVRVTADAGLRPGTRLQVESIDLE